MALIDFFRKKKQPMKRGYSGANGGRLFSDFVTSTRTPDAEIRYNLKVLRNRCRDLARNNEYAKRYLRLLKTNVVGEKGVNVQVKAINSDGSFDRIGNDIIENQFWMWGSMGNCTVDGRMSWIDAQDLFMESLARDGEVLIRMVNWNGNTDRFAIEFLEPDLIDEEKNESLQNGNTIRMGVEMDKYRRPVAYHILTQHPGEEFMNMGSSGRRTERVPADKILHVYMSDRAQQSRGVPWMATALASLKMLHGYREAELVAARTSASKMGFFTSPAGDGFTADDYDNQVPIMEAEPGTFHQLPTGVSFQQFDPQHPTSAFGEFEKSILRGIASGLGVSYYALANDLTAVSYSSIRAGELADRDFYRSLQRFMIDHFVRPVFRAWLQNAMTVGSVNLPINKYDKFANAAEFRGRGFNWVDPAKEISANVMALQNGLISM
jgi:lambda family phage portal protein